MYTFESLLLKHYSNGHHNAEQHQKNGGELRCSRRV